ncbi:MAG TPA: glycosyltransferase [Candidatus Mailhella merdavium]|nr:glycosyltransferase [Candidatus Mailhella merdavium]
MKTLRFALKTDIFTPSSAKRRRAEKAVSGLENIPDIHELCKQLEKTGQQCALHDMKAWGREDADTDVVVRIPGPETSPDETLASPYRPKPWNINLAVIDDPSRLPLAEHYDRILSPIPSSDVQELADILEQTARELLSSDTEEASALRERLRTEKARVVNPAWRREGPLVSILLGTHNRRKTLVRSLRSILAQSYTNWELPLVQDGGEDVADIVASINDPRIRLIRRETNGGMPRAYHTSFEHAKGSYIAWMSDDDIWYPDHLERLMLALRELPGVRFAYTDAMCVRLDMRKTPPQELERSVVHDRQLCLNDLMENNGIIGISPVHDRELYLQAGGLDPDQKVLIDFDLWRRMACLSCPYRVDAVTAEHDLKQGDKQGQITSLFKKSPLAYRVQRLRVLSKKLPLEAASPLWETWRTIRRRAVQNYALYQAMTALEAKDERRAERFRKLARRTMDPLSAVSLREQALLELTSKNPGEAFRLLFRILNSSSLDALPSDMIRALQAALMAGDFRHAEQLSLRIEEAERKAREEQRQLFPPEEQNIIKQYRALLEQYRSRTRQ